MSTALPATRLAPRRNPDLRDTQPPPVMEARRWLAESSACGPDLLNLSQAAPVDPPPQSLRSHLAEQMLSTGAAHLYGPVLGEPALREAVAARWSTDYQGQINPGDVAVTAGCNQAFCVAISALASQGDDVILPVPWYFNHQMWLRAQGIRVVAAEYHPETGGAPDIAEIRSLITPRTRALCLITPNNPTGTELSADQLDAYFELAQSAGIALILDETYRDFRSAESPAHRLFARPDWRGTLVHLYSFSKSFHLTGHRTGVMIAAPQLLEDAEKSLDCMTICPPRTGQIAALFGLEHLSDWVAAGRAEILRRRAALQEIFAVPPPGWRLLSSGAYFGYLAHDFALDSASLARQLVKKAGILLLPGTMFGPGDKDPPFASGTHWLYGDSPDKPGLGQQTLRAAYANATPEGLRIFAERLKAFTPMSEGS